MYATVPYAWVPFASPGVLTASAGSVYPIIGVNNYLFRRGLTHVCDIYRDQNRKGLSVSAHATVGDDWPDVPEWSNVPCRAVPARSKDGFDQDGRQDEQRSWHLFFGDGYPIDPACLIVVRDPKRPTLKPLKLFRPSVPRDAHFQGHHWTTWATEYIN